MIEPKISFIIPTLNEERHIETVLDQFKLLPKNISFEVIVSDGGSTDTTVQKARTLGATVVFDLGPETNIATGRNEGASNALGEILIFCDADTRFDNITTFIPEVLSLFDDKNVVAAIPEIHVFPNSSTLQDKVFHWAYNNIIRKSLNKKWCYGSGQCQVVRRSGFIKVYGYPSKRIHGEDTALFRRLVSIGQIVYLGEHRIYESPRRYRHYGYVPYVLMSLLSLFVHDVFNKNILKKWKRVGR